MPLGGRGFVSVGAVVACCALAAACTSEPASTSTPSPTPAATTPTESQIERQMRLDYEAAEKAYRDNIAEQDRLAQAGGVQQSDACAQVHRRRRISVRSTSLTRIHRKEGLARHAVARQSSASCRVGWQEKRVRLMSCEDGSRLRFIDSSGKDVTPKGDARFVSISLCGQRGGRWRVSGFRVQECQSRSKANRARRDLGDDVRHCGHHGHANACQRRRREVQQMDQVVQDHAPSRWG